MYLSTLRSSVTICPTLKYHANKVKCNLQQIFYVRITGSSTVHNGNPFRYLYHQTSDFSYTGKYNQKYYTDLTHLSKYNDYKQGYNNNSNTYSSKSCQDYYKLLFNTLMFSGMLCYGLKIVHCQKCSEEQGEQLYSDNEARETYVVDNTKSVKGTDENKSEYPIRKLYDSQVNKNLENELLNCPWQSSNIIDVNKKQFVCDHDNGGIHHKCHQLVGPWNHHKSCYTCHFNQQSLNNHLECADYQLQHGYYYMPNNHTTNCPYHQQCQGPQNNNPNNPCPYHQQCQGPQNNNPNNPCYQFNEQSQEYYLYDPYHQYQGSLQYHNDQSNQLNQPPQGDHHLDGSNPAHHDHVFTLNGGNVNDDNEAKKKREAEARLILSQAVLETGAPGIAASVTVDGKTVWQEGVGFACVETSSMCNTDSVFRIASISKTIAAALAMRLWEDGVLDLDKPVQEYVKEWPEKVVDGKKVDITVRHLLSHSSGIRHYHIKGPKLNDKDKEFYKKDTNIGKTSKEKSSNGDNKNKTKSSPSKETDNNVNTNKNSDSSTENIINTNNTKNLDSSKENFRSPTNQRELHRYVEERRRRLAPLLNQEVFINARNMQKKQKLNENYLYEVYINQTFPEARKALELFKNDELFFEPGTNFHYSSHGFTLLTCVLEEVTGKTFEKLAVELFKELGMDATFLDKHKDIIMRRGCSYMHDGVLLRNAPYVDNSHKWAGGGFLSSADDLCKFGNIMLYSLQATPHNINTHGAPKGFLKSSTVQQMWTPNFYPTTVNPSSNTIFNGYGLGWFSNVPNPARNCHGLCSCKGFMAYHTGAAVGASSVLIIVPTTCDKDWKVEFLKQSDLQLGDVGTLAVKDGTVEGKKMKKHKLQAKVNEDNLMEKISTEVAKGKVDEISESKAKFQVKCVISTDKQDCNECNLKNDVSDTNSGVDSSLANAKVSGVVVTIITNISGVNLTNDAVKIAHIFKDVK